MESEFHRQLRSMFPSGVLELTSWRGRGRPTRLAISRLPGQTLRAYGVWLESPPGADDNRQVGTFATAALMATRQVGKIAGTAEGAGAAAAGEAVEALGDLTQPIDAHRGDTLDEPIPGVTQAIARHLRNQAYQFQTWPQGSWTCDGIPRPAFTFQFAGAWAGFALPQPDVCVIVVGPGTSSAPVELLSTAADAGNTSTTSIHVAELAHALRQGGDHPAGSPNIGRFHADQLRHAH
jgi:hypothetical protein